jgi:UDP-N-acetylmuramoyl-tripeptide--D-alanyl-D-alanine ligase
MEEGGSEMFTHEDVLQALAAELCCTCPGTAAAVYPRAVVDSRQVQAGDLFIGLRGERHDGSDFAAEAIARGAAGVLVERPPDVAAAAVYVVRDSLRALHALAGYVWRQRPLPVLAITGTVGKTSTKEVAARLFSRRYRVLMSEGGLNGEIGWPLVLLRREPVHEFAVLELGMYRRGEISLQCELAPPRYGIVTNIGYTHMERLGSLEAIVAAKQELVEHIPPEGTVALNGDDPRVLGMRAAARGRVLTYGTTSTCDVRGTELESHGRAGIAFTLWADGRSVRVRAPLPGAHNLYTCLAAATAALADGFSLEEIAAGLAEAANPLRLKFLDGPGGTLIIDDTYNASPASMTAALRVLAEQRAGRRIAVLGDMLELGAVEEECHHELGRQAAAVVDLLFTVGPRARWTAEAARAAGLAAVRHFPSKEGLAAAVRAELRPGDAVLLKGSRGLALETIVAELLAG